MVLQWILASKMSELLQFGNFEIPVFLTHPVDIIVFVSTTVSLKDEYINKLTSSSTVRDIIGVIDVSGGDQAKDRQENSYDTRSHDWCRICIERKEH